MHITREELKCDLCDFTKKYQKSLEKHIRVIHLDTKIWECDKCEFVSLNNQSVKSHVKNVQTYTMRPCFQDGRNSAQLEQIGVNKCPFCTSVVKKRPHTYTVLIMAKNIGVGDG
jgi:ribosomal protein L37AE/L43A